MIVDCLSNLDKCKASCCKLITFNVRCFPGSNIEDYYLKRGLTIHRLDRNTITVLVPSVCNQLDENNKCKLHGTNKKPVSCCDLNEKTIKSGKYWLTEGCLLKK